MTVAHIAVHTQRSADDFVERARDVGVGMGFFGYGTGIIPERSIVAGLARLSQL